MSHLSRGWDDLMVVSTQAITGSSALTLNFIRDSGVNGYFFRHDQDDDIGFYMQLPHRRRPGSVIESVHLHLMPAVAPSASPQVAYFRTYYAWVPINVVVPTVGSWVGPVYSSFSIATADAFKHKLHDILSDITYSAGDASEAYSSMLICRVTRLSSSGSDTYKTNRAEAVPPATAAANLLLLSADAHYLADRHGSYLEASDTP